MAFGGFACTSSIVFLPCTINLYPLVGSGLAMQTCEELPASLLHLFDSTLYTSKMIYQGASLSEHALLI